MLSFRAVTFSDRLLIERYRNATPTQQLNYTFHVLYVYRNACEFQIAECGGFLFIKTFVECRHNFLYPLGTGDLSDAIEQMMDYSLHHRCEFILFQLREEHILTIELLFPSRFQFDITPDQMEYCYLADRLITLAGKRLQPKRNHINALQKEHSVRFAPIDASNIDLCRRYNEIWLEQHHAAHSTIKPIEQRNAEIEEEALNACFEDFFTLSLDGGILFVDEAIVGFSIGCPIDSSDYLVMFEKTDPTIRGAYAAINQLFVTTFCRSFTYINRSEDAGIEGLRRAKSSYYPDRLLPLYALTCKNNE